MFRCCLTVLLFIIHDIKIEMWKNRYVHEFTANTAYESPLSRIF